MPTQVVESIACPLCGKPIDSAFLTAHRELEEPVTRILREKHPGWDPVEGACPNCAHEAVQEAARSRSTTSIHRELQLPYPVYSRERARILPTPHRVHATSRYTGLGVTIAFLDSGFYPHPDLTRPKNRILRYADATDTIVVEKEHFRKPGMSSWHGLMTTCVAAGNGSSSDHLYPGLAPRANLVVVKTGNRRGRRIHDQDIARALAWVILNRKRYDIRVVNISLGGDRPADPLKQSQLDELVEEAVARGMVVIAAAGNGGVRRIIPPASAPSAITVGGLDDQNSLDTRHYRMYHSNFGLGYREVVKPELIAPAIWLAAPMLPKTWVHNEALFLWRLEHASDEELGRILDTDYARARFTKRTLGQPIEEIRRAIRQRMIEQKYIHPHYQHVDGTSFAAPIVAGIVAQMIEANPALLPQQVKDILIGTAIQLAGVPFDQQGYGVVIGATAVAGALRAPGGPLEGFPGSPHAGPEGISFTYYSPEARSVAVAGRFNHWQTRGYHLRKRAPGVWQLAIAPLARGVYPYKFVIDGSEWICDPENPSRSEDGYGEFNSLLSIP